MSSNLPNIAVSNGGDIITQEEYIRQMTATTVSADSVGDGGPVVSSNVQMVLKGGVEKREQAQPVNFGLWLQDIAQSHHYTVQIAGFTEYKVPHAPYSNFLPVKSINLSYVSYENMTIPFQIFGDFPILNRKRVSTISLSCFDNDSNTLEKELRAWERACFPLNRYVAYMEEIAREFIYRGYNVKGKQTFEARLFVIPSGSVSISRDYSANDAKMVNFSVVAVGDGVSCATGLGAGDIPIIDHGGAGDGTGSRHHTLWGTLKEDENGQVQSYQ